VKIGGKKKEKREVHKRDPNKRSVNFETPPREATDFGVSWEGKRGRRKRKRKMPPVVVADHHSLLKNMKAGQRKTGTKAASEKGEKRKGRRRMETTRAERGVELYQWLAR